MVISKLYITMWCKYWLKDNLYHRLNGPAIDYTNKEKYWFQNGRKHRLDGPAIVYADGRKEWYLNENRFNTQEQFERYIKLLPFQ